MSEYRIIHPYVPDYVEHHGILGMHWGRKNGPPYPLSQSEHNSVVKGAKKGKSVDSDRANASLKKRRAKEISKAQKKKAKGYSKRLNDLDKTIGSSTAQMTGLKVSMKGTAKASNFFSSTTGNKYKVTSKGKQKNWAKKKRSLTHIPLII